MKRICLLMALAVLAVTLTGCGKKPKKDYNRQLPPGELALRKITDPNQIPDYTAACSDTAQLRESIRNSLNYLGKASSKKFFPYGEVTHEQAKRTLLAMEHMIDSGMSAYQMNQELRTSFDSYISVGCDDAGTVLYTGYYTPIFDGSPVRTERFKYPLYSQPDDIVKGPDGQILGRRGPDGQVRQFPSRAEIESSGIMKGKELVWLGNAFEVYIAHVQGSAKIRMANGKLQTYGYAANNGWEYSSVSQQLVSEGKMDAEKRNLKTMIEYFNAHPDEVASYVEKNPRFVFFQPIEGSPRGSLNEPVTAFRTIATDKTIYPRACLAYVAADLARPVGWALDQDTGGAIRAAGRCDVYMGVGDEAAELAGGTYKEGKLYYVFLKPGAGSNLLPMETAPSDAVADVNYQSNGAPAKSQAPVSGGSISEAKVPRR